MTESDPVGMLTHDELGERIRRQRCSLGLTQGQLAERAGVSKETVGRLEQAVGAPTLDTVFKVARALGRTGSALLATCASDEVFALVGGLPEREQEIACVMLRALSAHVSTR
ncbi:anaerobic benzoate catabolism transcriptional regulator [Enhygromyxa salina]|uniref:Anaerobic benzoate catabolism transcriptional regulator n=2 Tax=Enhygromyxa salina TaxID=215803 RepID=A0A2S9XCT9_9BACT|nr:anaerobic benzoate catabolism transcriptional regulator [Enhygromyxa salina]